MITPFTFIDKAGLRQFTVMAHMQTGPDTQVVAVGIDKDNFPNNVFESVEGVEVLEIGKLSEWQGITGLLFRNTLYNFGWDFAKYPDPELIQLTDNRVKP